MRILLTTIFIKKIGVVCVERKVLLGRVGIIYMRRRWKRMGGFILGIRVLFEGENILFFIELYTSRYVWSN